MSKQQKLTGKQRSFVFHYCTPNTPAYNNATHAAIAAGYSRKTADKVTGQILSSIGVKREMARFKADIAMESKFTRESQLKDLQEVKDLARVAKNLTAFTGAIREQNEMLGYHREAAPNEEKEQAKQAIAEAERKELEQLSKTRTDKLSTTKPVLQLHKTG